MKLYIPDAVFHTTEGGRFFRDIRHRESVRKGAGGERPGHPDDAIRDVKAESTAKRHYPIVLRRVEGQWLIAEQMWAQVPEPK